MSATEPGTDNYFKKHPFTQRTVLGKTFFNISRVGFGGYRVHEGNPEHADALELALKSGCNLIDTSSNYTDGSSERLIGNTLRNLFASGELKREEVVVVSKGGYIQGTNLALARNLKQTGTPFPEVVECHPDCWHCISPAFLEDQITRSLERLGLDRIDVFLLHNPEYFLKADPNHGEYYRRIGQAFAHLEKEAARGRIEFYGISSNTFGEPKSHPEFTSLETVLELAEQTSPKNRFAVIQFPLNLLECGGVVENNNAHRTVAELADASKLGVLVNRPLNAYNGRDLIRFAHFDAHDETAVVARLDQALADAVHHEMALTQEGTPDLQTWARVLTDHRKDIRSLIQWRDIVSYQIAPFLDALKDPAHQPYRESLSRAVQAMGDFLESRESARSSRILEAFSRYCPSLKSSPSLSQKTVRILGSFPGVQGVLVGMRRPSYVRDIIGKAGPLSTNEAFEALNAISELIENDKLGVTT